MICPQKIYQSVRRAEHVAHVGEKYKQVSMGKPEGKEHLEDVSIDGRVVLNWVLKVSMGWLALYLPGL